MRDTKATKNTGLHATLTGNNGAAVREIETIVVADGLNPVLDHKFNNRLPGDATAPGADKGPISTNVGEPGSSAPGPDIERKSKSFGGSGSPVVGEKPSSTHVAQQGVSGGSSIDIGTNSGGGGSGVTFEPGGTIVPIQGAVGGNWQCEFHPIQGNDLHDHVPNWFAIALGLLLLAIYIYHVGRRLVINGHDNSTEETSRPPLPSSTGYLLFFVLSVMPILFLSPFLSEGYSEMWASCDGYPFLYVLKEMAQFYLAELLKSPNSIAGILIIGAALVSAFSISNFAVGYALMLKGEDELTGKKKAYLVGLIFSILTAIGSVSSIISLLSRM